MEEEERKRTPLLPLAAGPGLPGRGLQPFPAAAQGRCPQQDGAELFTGSGPSTEILSSRSKKMEVLRPKEPVSTETEQLKALRMELAVKRSALDKIQKEVGSGREASLDSGVGRQKPPPDQVFVTPVGIGQLERGGTSVRPRGVSTGELIDLAPLPEGGYLQDRAGLWPSGSEAGGNGPSRGSFIPSARVDHSGGSRERKRAPPSQALASGDGAASGTGS